MGRVCSHKYPTDAEYSETIIKMGFFYITGSLLTLYMLLCLSHNGKLALDLNQYRYIPRMRKTIDLHRH